LVEHVITRGDEDRDKKSDEPHDSVLKPEEAEILVHVPPYPVP
jgi:hypothetical protein